MSLKQICIFTMDAYVLAQPPRKPKPKYGIDLCKALKTMGFNGWSELVPGMYSNPKVILFS
jgi:hypothetical protein